MEINVVGGQLRLGNILMRMRYVSWIQSNVGFPEQMMPAEERRERQREAVGRSGFSG